MFKLQRKQGENIEIYEYQGVNFKGETLLMDITKCTNPGGKNSLPYLWKQHGYTKEIMETWWSVSTYVTDKDGNCRHAYNPTLVIKKEVHKGKVLTCRPCINFEWLLEATEENKKKLLNEVENRFLKGVKTNEETTIC